MTVNKVVDIDAFMSELREQVLGREAGGVSVNPDTQLRLMRDAIDHLRLANRARESLPAKLDILPLSGFNRALLALWERSTRSRRKFNDNLLLVLELLQALAASQGRATSDALLAVQRENLELRQRLDALQRRLEPQS